MAFHEYKPEPTKPVVQTAETAEKQIKYIDYTQTPEQIKAIQDVEESINLLTRKEIRVEYKDQLTLRGLNISLKSRLVGQLNWVFSTSTLFRKNKSADPNNEMPMNLWGRSWYALDFMIAYIIGQTWKVVLRIISPENYHTQLKTALKAWKNEKPCKGCGRNK